MDFRIRKNGAWSNSIQEIKIKTSSIWQNIQSGYIKVLGSWQQFFGSSPVLEKQVEISQTSNMDYIVTLIGTNYHWTNFVS